MENTHYIVFSTISGSQHIVNHKTILHSELSFNFMTQKV